MNRRHRRARTVAAAAAAAVVTGLPAVLAGCASPSSDQAPAAGVCPSPGVTDETVRIGLVYPDSGGPLATNFKAVRSAVEARIAAQNEAGGVHNREVEVVWRDDQADPDVFAHAARDLITNENVFGLIVQTTAAGPSTKWLEETGIPLTGNAIDASWSQHKNVFTFASLFNTQGDPVDTFGRYVTANGGTKALIVLDPAAPGASALADRFEPSLASQGVAVERFDFSASASPARVVDALRRAGADTMIGLVQPQRFADAYAAAKAGGVTVDVALSAAGYGEELLAKGSAVGGMSVVVGYTSFEASTPAMQAYQTAMATYAPELADPNVETALASYVAADEMLAGLELAGPCPTRDAFITNLRNVKDFDGGGLIAPTDLSNPTAPASCFNFVKADPAGSTFQPVPPATADSNGFWCGEPVS
ncbi:ABC transporter substrate-binding protein [Frankia sp. CNm7]|uniref:ABC transporter substrate-binding protein n=1 Tax=Frankia nepalensis TaxID=1836974 RepID=A0A937RDP6_9ACTN|nr:ABC transporter substrate-binding protein [Frankia nepalensis]MBL7500453.1 ABC transporter substrate-binding protein [Frankia nepalensis]MBL7511186.1 ABC transporter substrate-binding protein [Frankia nepalensis]MBL7524445.1 ABC transporter substrate-binding protein [Frankia nepalensis]MBL7626974.1 ABC transporter substrate-binding protein [Frankia nepalensis]